MVTEGTVWHCNYTSDETEPVFTKSSYSIIVRSGKFQPIAKAAMQWRKALTNEKQCEFALTILCVNAHSHCVNTYILNLQSSCLVLDVLCLLDCHFFSCDIRGRSDVS